MLIYLEMKNLIPLAANFLIKTRMKYYILLPVLLISGICLCQQDKELSFDMPVFDTVQEKFYCQDMVFESTDTSIKAHYVLNEKGQYTFYRGYCGSPGKTSYLISKIEDSNDTAKNVFVEQEKFINPHIDTIKSFFPLNDKLISSQDTITTGRWLLHNDALLASFKLSYLLAFLKTKCGFIYEEGSVLSVAKSMYAYDEENHTEKDEYWICKENLKGEQSQNIFFYEIASADLSGYFLKMADSVSVPQNQFKRLRRLIMKQHEMPDFDFCELENVDEQLVAIGNKKFFFSYECLRERKEKRNMKVYNKISQEIYSICFKNIKYIK